MEGQGGSQGWLLFTLVCLLLASSYTVASARLVPGFHQVQSRDAEELAHSSGQQHERSVAWAQSEPQGWFPKARSLRGQRFLMEYFMRDYAEPNVDTHPSPPPFGRAVRHTRPVEVHAVDSQQPP